MVSSKLHTVELLFALMLAIIVLAAAGAVYQMAGSAIDARRFPAGGRLVDLDGFRLHIDEAGQGAPAVVFEAGIAATSLSWKLVQPEIAKFTRAVSYDRAWLGSSDSTRRPRAIRNVIEELRNLLGRANVGAPRILVAHSYGGLIALAYAMRYPADIAGMVLADPVTPEEWAEPPEMHRRTLDRGIRLSRRGAVLARLGIVRLALTLLSSGARRLPRLVARASSGRGVLFTERMVGEIRKLPHEVWPMIQAHWCDPKSFEGMARYLEALPESAAAVGAEIARARSVFDFALGDIPLTILSAGNTSPAQRAGQQDLAALSSRGRLEVVEDSGHWIQLNRPDVVIRAAAETVASVRRP